MFVVSHPVVLCKGVWPSPAFQVHKTGLHMQSFLNPPPRVSTDNQTIFLSVNMSLSADVAPGSRSIQSFSNAAFTCCDEDVYSANSAAAAADAESKQQKKSPSSSLVALAGAPLPSPRDIASS